MCKEERYFLERYNYTLECLCCVLFAQDLPFDDGMGPPNDVIEQYFEVIRSRFKEDPNSCIAVHCIAGLGRLAFVSKISMQCGV